MMPSEYLALADSKFASGEYREAAHASCGRLLKTVFVDLADSHGLDYTEDFISLAKALEKHNSVPKLYYRGSLTTGKLLRDHAEMDVLENVEVEFAYETARKFILRSCGDK